MTHAAEYSGTRPDAATSLSFAPAARPLATLLEISAIRKSNFTFARARPSPQATPAVAMGSGFFKNGGHGSDLELSQSVARSRARHRRWLLSAEALEIA
jgi:hypothetical protein